MCPSLMRTRRCFFVLMPLALAAHAAMAAVSVTHADPTRFTDATDRATDPANVMRELKTHLERLGERYLAPGSEVRIEVHDVDLAGRHDNLPDVRIVRGRADFPCIDLSYARDAAAPQRERVCDLNYTRRLRAPYNDRDPLVYEKRMLEEWFQKRFAAK